MMGSVVRSAWTQPGAEVDTGGFHVARDESITAPTPAAGAVGTVARSATFHPCSPYRRYIRACAAFPLRNTSHKFAGEAKPMGAPYTHGAGFNSAGMSGGIPTHRPVALSSFKLLKRRPTASVGHYPLD